MFVLVVLIAIFISGISKNYNHKLTAMSPLQRMFYGYNLPLIKLFTVNNNYLPLIKTFTVHRIIYR